MIKGWVCFCGWCWPLTSPDKDSPEEDLTAGVSFCVELKKKSKTAQAVKISIIPLVVPAVRGLCSSPPPAGQLCTAATSLLAAGVDAQSGGALLRHQNPWTLPVQLWLRAALDTSSTTSALYVRRLWLFWLKDKGFFVFCFLISLFLSNVAFSHPRLSLRRAEAHCLWRSATVRCPITNRALRSHRHRALLSGAKIARRDSGGTREHRGISSDRGVLRSSAFWRITQQKWGYIILSSSLFYFIVVPLHITLLTGTRHAASFPTRWTGVGHLTW